MAPALPFARMRHPPADLTPPTIAALGAALAEARSVRIVGTQSLASRTTPPPPNALVVSTAALSDLEVEPLDLIARVQAGVKLENLQHRLSEHGLVWPVERLEPGGTVGGLIASGRGSAVRAGDAPARRWILGATVVLASGESIHVGGATVKFSAGYGLTHAMWGAGGLLGALAEVTLRLRHAVPGGFNRRLRAPGTEPGACVALGSPGRGAAGRIGRARVGIAGPRVASRRERRRLPCPDRVSRPRRGGGRRVRDSESGRLGRNRPAACGAAPTLGLVAAVVGGSRSRRTARLSDRRPRSPILAAIGAWRSQVARIVRDDEVGGSNPLAPTSLRLLRRAGPARRSGRAGSDSSKSAGRRSRLPQSLRLVASMSSCGAASSSNQRPSACNTTCAALWPGAPVTSPPGWVPAPQR